MNELTCSAGMAVAIPRCAFYDVATCHKYYLRFRYARAAVSYSTAKAILVLISFSHRHYTWAAIL